MADLQVPPAVGTSGQRLDTIVINAGSTIFRQTVVIGDPSSSGALANVSSGGHQWIVSASSGLVQILTTGPLVTASSGQQGTYPSTGRQYTPFAFNASSSNSITNVTAVQTILYGWNLGNQTTSATASVKLYNSTAPTAGSTSNLLVTIPIPGGSAGAGNNLLLTQGVNFSSAFTIVVTGNFAATSTGTFHSAGDVVGTFYYV